MRPRVRRYVNALDVLPLDVVQRISEARGGGEVFLFVPATRPNWRELRAQRVVELYEKGLRVDEIAGVVFVTERSVWRILARKRALAAPSATAPETGFAQPSKENDPCH